MFDTMLVYFHEVSDCAKEEELIIKEFEDKHCIPKIVEKASFDRLAMVMLVVSGF